jgi:uncharacterized protein YkwD
MRNLARRFAVATPLLVAALIAPSAASATTCTGADTAPALLGANANRVTLCLLNNERHAHGLRSFKLDGKLSVAAAGHSSDMVAHRYFDHNSRDGKDFSVRIKHAGWMHGRRSWTIGENIGWGAGDLATPRAMVNAWMHSAGHRANILERHFRMIGVGIAIGSPSGDANGATYSTDFGG